MITDQILSPLNASENGQEDSGDEAQDVNLEELAQLLYEKLRFELQLENERTGKYY